MTRGSRARRPRGLVPRRDAPEGRLRLRAGPDLPRRVAGPGQVSHGRPQAVRGPLQGPPRAMGRSGRADVAGQVLRGEGRDRPGDRPVQAAPRAHGPRAAGASAQRRLLLRRRPGQAQGVPAGRRPGHGLAPHLQPPRGAADQGGPRRPARAGQGDRRPDAADVPGRQAGGGAPDPRRGQPGRALCVAVQERCAGPAQEVQAQRGDEGRGDRPAHLPGRHGEGRRRHRLARVGPGHPPPEGRGAQGRHRPRARQGQHGAVQPGVLLLHEQAVLRGIRAGRPPGAAVPAGRALVQGDVDRHAGARRGV